MEVICIIFHKYGVSLSQVVEMPAKMKEKHLKFHKSLLGIMKVVEDDPAWLCYGKWLYRNIMKEHAAKCMHQAAIKVHTSSSNERACSKHL